MSLKDMVLSARFLISLAVLIVISVLLTFFPLIGTLGFEYSTFIAFVAAFVSIFVSAELVNIDLSKGGLRRLSDIVSSVFMVNFILVAVPFVIGLVSSVVKKDCYILEGSIFYLLIPVVTVYFSTSLGLLTGFVFKRRGFFIGALILLATIFYSLYRIFYDPSLFVYNPVIGFFPGPLYDEAIPITLTLILYRLIVIFWGILFLIILNAANGVKYKKIGFWDFISLALVICILFIAHSKEQEIGISYSREYITSEVLPGKYETDNFIIYYDPSTPEAKQIDLIAEDHEWRYKQLKDFLQVDSNEKIRSYIYPDTKTRKKIIGAGETTIANPIHKEIHLIYNSFPHPILKHELTHVMSADFGMDVFKVSPKIGLLEGIAVAADWSGDGYTKHQWAKTMIEKGMAPRIQDIIGFGFWYSSAPVSYTLMGSFSRYLIDTYGIDKYKTLYKTGKFDQYGKSIDDLVDEWTKFLNTVTVPEEAPILAESIFGTPSIFEARCPRRIAALKQKGFNKFKSDDYYNARELFIKALGYNQADPITINGLAYSYYFDGKYDKVNDLIKDSKSIPSLDRNILANLRANSLWQSGDRGEALRIFSTLRSKPLPADVKREIDIKLSAMAEGGPLEDSIKMYFGTRDEVTRVNTLQEIIREYPEYAPAHYLLGRLLFNKNEYQKALPYLLSAEAASFPSPDLEKENMRILGISLFATKNQPQAIKRFQKLLDLNKDMVSNDFATDFIERSQWSSERNLK